jgi:L-asparaginase II
VAGPGGVLAASDAGAAARPVFARSTTKPLQALPAVRSRLLDRLGLGERHLALACASHGGGPEHVAGVRELLAAAGATEADLACGPLVPRDPAVALAGGTAPSCVVNNCSGKHALALALCRDRGWPVAGYHEEGHPLQLAMRAAVAGAAGGAVVGEAVDGCGMRTYRLPLGALAAAFGRLASGGLGPAGARVAHAMRAHPELVGFRGAIDTELMAAEPGVVAKIGAAGVLALGLPDGRGLAVKVLDGSARALDAAGVALAREALDLPAATPALEALGAGAVRNTRGEAVGAVEVALSARPRHLAAVR